MRRQLRAFALVAASCSPVKEPLAPMAAPSTSQAQGTKDLDAQTGPRSVVPSQENSECSPDGPPLAATSDLVHTIWKRRVLNKHGTLQAVAADRQGNAFVGGTERHGTDVGQAFLEKYDPQGRRSWRMNPAGRFPSPWKAPSTGILHLSISPAGDAFVVGYSGGRPTYLTKVNSRGKLDWSQPLVGDPTSLDVDDSGNVFVVTWNGEAVSSPRATQLGIETGHLLVSKLGQDGSSVWAHQFRFDRISRARRVILGHDSGGNLMVASTVVGTVEFEGRSFDHDGQVTWRCEGQDKECHRTGQGLLIASLSPEGRPTWARTFGAPENDVEPTGIAVWPSGDFAVTGTFSGGPLAFSPLRICESEPGAPPLPDSGFHEMGGPDPCECRQDRNDLFVATFGRDGTTRWAKTLAVGINPPAIAVDASGTLVWGGLVQQSARLDSTRSPILVELDASGSVVHRSAIETPGVPMLANDGRSRLVIGQGDSLILATLH